MLPSTLDTDNYIYSLSYEQRMFKYNNDGYDKNDLKSKSVMAKLLNSFDRNSPRNKAKPALKLIPDESSPPEIHRMFLEINI